METFINNRSSKLFMSVNQLEFCFMPAAQIVPLLPPNKLNDDFSFGFTRTGVMDKLKSLARRKNVGRIIRGKEQNDGLNFRVAKHAYRGFHQVEMDGFSGMPKNALERLNTVDIMALYAGIDLLKGQPYNQVQDLIGLNFSKLVSYLVGAGYEISADNCAAQMLREANSKKVGFHQRWNNSLENRLEELAETDKITGMRSFFQPRFYSQEEAGEGCEFQDIVYNFTRREHGAPIDSNKSRERYVQAFIEKMVEKNKWDDHYTSNNFIGKIVPSNTTPGKVYLVQKRIIPTFTRVITTYSCSCPHGYKKMVQEAVKGDECTHLKKFKEEI